METRLCAFAATLLILVACEKQPALESPLPNKLEVKEDTTLIKVLPDDILYVALKDFINEQSDQSATRIRTSVYYMRALASNAASDADRKQAMDKAIESLEDLADRISSKQVEDLAEVNSVLAETGRALAGYRLWIVQREYASKSVSESGALLEKTIRQLKRSVKMHSRALNKEEERILDHGLEIARQLKAGNRVDENELRNVVLSIDQEIEKWNQEIERAQ